MRAPQLTYTDMIKVTGWIQAHKDSLLSMTRSEISRQISKDLGVQVSADRLRDFEDAAGIVRQRGNATGGRKDRTFIVACELVRLMKEVGMTPSPDLVDIANHK